MTQVLYLLADPAWGLPANAHTHTPYAHPAWGRHRHCTQKLAPGTETCGTAPVAGTVPFTHLIHPGPSSSCFWDTHCSYPRCWCLRHHSPQQLALRPHSAPRAADTADQGHLHLGLPGNTHRHTSNPTTTITHTPTHTPTHPPPN